MKHLLASLPILFFHISLHLLPSLASPPHLLASLPILASLTSPANCQPDPAMLFHERPGTCRGTSLEAGDGAVGRDEALCGSDAREAWALGISARGLFGLWRGMELVAAFSEGARVKTNPSQTGLTLTISSAASASFTSVYLADSQAYSQAYV